MTDKTSKQSALDYDPLAWLDEGPTNGEATVDEEKPRAETSSPAGNELSRQSEAQVAHSQPVSVVAAPEPLEEASAADGEGYGFFDDGPGVVKTQAARVDDSGRIIETGADLTIRSVAMFKQLVDERIRQGLDVTVSAKGLQKIDTAGIQMLYSLNESLAKTQQSINWESPSPLINDVAGILGMPGLTPEAPDQEDIPASAPAEQQESGFGFF